MSRTVTALYDTKAEAEAARQRLSSAVDVDDVKIIDGTQSSGSGSAAIMCPTTIATMRGAPARGACFARGRRRRDGDRI